MELPQSWNNHRQASTNKSPTHPYLARPKVCINAVPDKPEVMEKHVLRICKSCREGREKLPVPQPQKPKHEKKIRGIKDSQNLNLQTLFRDFPSMPTVQEKSSCAAQAQTSGLVLKPFSSNWAIFHSPYRNPYIIIRIVACDLLKRSWN